MTTTDDRPVIIGTVPLVSPVPADRLEDVLALYAQAWWTKHRDRTKVARILAGAQPTIGALDPDGRLIGFVRVLTDYEFKAVIVDVIVDRYARGHGLGRRLVQAAVDHPALAAVEDFELYCSEALIPFYAAAGFCQPDGTRFLRCNSTTQPSRR